MFSKELNSEINKLEENVTTIYQRAMIEDLRSVEDMTTADYLYLKKFVIAKLTDVPVGKVQMSIEDKKEYSQISFIVKDKKGKPAIVEYVINSGLEGKTIEDRLQGEEFVSFQFLGKECKNVNFYKSAIYQDAIKARMEDVEQGRPMRSWQEACIDTQKQILPIDLKLEKKTKGSSKLLEPLIDFVTLNNNQH